MAGTMAGTMAGNGWRNRENMLGKCEDGDGCKGRMVGNMLGEWVGHMLWNKMLEGWAGNEALRL